MKVNEIIAIALGLLILCALTLAAFFWGATALSGNSMQEDRQAEVLREQAIWRYQNPDPSTDTITGPATYVPDYLTHHQTR